MTGENEIKTVFPHFSGQDFLEVNGFINQLERIYKLHSDKYDNEEKKVLTACLTEDALEWSVEAEEENKEVLATWEAFKAAFKAHFASRESFFYKSNRVTSFKDFIFLLIVVRLIKYLHIDYCHSYELKLCETSHSDSDRCFFIVSAVNVIVI